MFKNVFRYGCLFVVVVVLSSCSLNPLTPSVPNIDLAGGAGVQGGQETAIAEDATSVIVVNSDKPLVTPVFYEVPTIQITPGSDGTLFEIYGPSLGPGCVQVVWPGKLMIGKDGIVQLIIKLDIADRIDPTVQPFDASASLMILHDRLDNLYPVLHAELAGPRSMNISPVGGPDKVLSSSGTAQWAWYVNPSSVGEHTLILSIDVLVDIGGEGVPFGLRNYPLKILVDDVSGPSPTPTLTVTPTPTVTPSPTATLTPTVTSTPTGTLDLAGSAPPNDLDYATALITFSGAVIAFLTYRSNKHNAAEDRKLKQRELEQGQAIPNEQELALQKQQAIQDAQKVGLQKQKGTRKGTRSKRK